MLNHMICRSEPKQNVVYFSHKFCSTVFYSLPQIFGWRSTRVNFPYSNSYMQGVVAGECATGLKLANQHRCQIDDPSDLLSSEMRLWPFNVQLVESTGCGKIQRSDNIPLECWFELLHQLANLFLHSLITQQYWKLLSNVRFTKGKCSLPKWLLPNPLAKAINNQTLTHQWPFCKEIETGQSHSTPYDYNVILIWTWLRFIVYSLVLSTYPSFPQSPKISWPKRLRRAELKTLYI